MKKEGQQWDFLFIIGAAMLPIETVLKADETVKEYKNIIYFPN